MDIERHTKLCYGRSNNLGGRAVYRVMQRITGEACGIKGNRALVVWSATVDNNLAEAFAEKLNEHLIEEDELFDATHEFLMDYSSLVPLF